MERWPQFRTDRNADVLAAHQTAFTETSGWSAKLSRLFLSISTKPRLQYLTVYYLNTQKVLNFALNQRTHYYCTWFKTSKLLSSKHKLKAAVKSTLCQTFPGCYSLTWGATHRAGAGSTHTCTKEHMCTRARSFPTPWHVMRKNTLPKQLLKARQST